MKQPLKHTADQLRVVYNLCDQAETALCEAISYVRGLQPAQTLKEAEELLQQANTAVCPAVNAWWSLVHRAEREEARPAPPPH